MWLLAMSATGTGMTFLGFGLTESWDWETPTATWTIGRGAVLVALGVASFQADLALALLGGAMGGSVHAQMLQVVTTMLLSALVLCRFGEDRPPQFAPDALVTRRAHSRPISQEDPLRQLDIYLEHRAARRRLHRRRSTSTGS